MVAAARAAIAKILVFMFRVCFIPWLQGKETFHVLFVLICLANQTGIDLTAALEKNLVKKSIRDKERHANNEKLK